MRALCVCWLMCVNLTFCFDRNAGIYPSSSKSYSLSSMQAATRSAFGQNVTFRCSSGALNEVWIYFHTSGRSTTVSAFSQVAPLSGDTNCPSTLKWLPK